MINKEQYQRTFGVLHASELNFKEETRMKTNPFPIRKALTLCAVVALMLSLAVRIYKKYHTLDMDALYLMMSDRRKGGRV